MVEFAYEQVVDYKLNYIYNVITVEARTASMLKGTNIMKEINISNRFKNLHFNSPLCTKFIEKKKWQHRAINSVLPQTKAYLTSFKKTTNPNVSPIGKRFGFECFGASDGT